MSAKELRRKFVFKCGCCEPNFAASGVNLDRRNFISSGVAAMGLGTAAPVAGILPGLAMTSAVKKRIDVHHHFLPPVHGEALAKHKMGVPKWSVAMSLEDMDKSGIAISMLSQVQPGTWFGDAGESRQLSRSINEFGAKVMQDHPGRFGLFATISPPDVEGSLKEIAYAFDALKADGIGLLTSYSGKYLGEDSYAPIYEELNRRKAVIYVHPLTPLCCSGVVPGIPPGAIEYSTDTTRTIAHLVFSGTATKYPDIRWIFSHSGGTLPFLTARFVRLWNERKHAHLPNGPLPEFRKFYYELAQGNTPGQIAALLKMVPPAQVLYGTDFPYRDGAEVNQGIADHRFDSAELRAIERENARRLMPRLKV